MSKHFNAENLWIQILLFCFISKNVLAASQAKSSEPTALPGTTLVVQGNMYSYFSSVELQKHIKVFPHISVDAHKFGIISCSGVSDLQK